MRARSATSARGIRRSVCSPPWSTRSGSRPPRELGFGEIKTDLLERLETIRSKSPVAVAQELWGILLVYNLVRLEMERIAAELGVAPTRISFVAALREFAAFWLLGSKTLKPRRSAHAACEGPGSHPAIRLAASSAGASIPSSRKAQDEQLRA
jgi:hypothetical protein